MGRGLGLPICVCQPFGTDEIHGPQSDAQKPPVQGSTERARVSGGSRAWRGGRARPPVRGPGQSPEAGREARPTVPCAAWCGRVVPRVTTSKGSDMRNRNHETTADDEQIAPAYCVGCFLKVLDECLERLTLGAIPGDMHALAGNAQSLLTDALLVLHDFRLDMREGSPAAAYMALIMLRDLMGEAEELAQEAGCKSGIHQAGKKLDDELKRSRRSRQRAIKQAKSGAPKAKAEAKGATKQARSATNHPRGLDS